VKGGYTDGHGTAENKTSTGTAKVANVNDKPTGLPTISGTPTQNQTLTAVTSGIADPDGLGTFSYQWMAAGVAISGATSSTLKLTQDQVNKAITVNVTYTDGYGTVETLTSAASTAVANVNDAPTGAVTIDGARVLGMPLEAKTSTVADIDGLGTFSYQWLRAGVAINGATSSKYTPIAADKDTDISVRVSYTDAFGAAEALTSAAVKVVDENGVTPLTVSGVTPVAGDGNGDGIADAAQAAVVSAPLTVKGANNTTSSTFVTLVADASASGGVNSGSTAVIQTMGQQVAPSTKPSQLSAPLDLIDFTATTQKGQTESFTLFVDKSLNVNGYWKQDDHGTWVNLASKPFGGATTVVGNKIRLDFKITDGGVFDNDHKADGIITDPAIIGQMALSVVGYTPDVTLTPSTHFFF